MLQVGILLLGYFLGRVAFVLANAEHFSDALKWHVLVQLFMQGMVFDLSAIFLTNLIYVILVLLPFSFTLKQRYQRTLFYLFLIPNCLFLLSNFIDAAYFPFTGKRMQADALLFVTGAKGDDFFRLLPSFLWEYWYLWLFSIGLGLAVWKIYQFSLRFDTVVEPNRRNKNWSIALLVCGLGITLLAARGGLQVRPLDFIHAAEWTDVQNIPILLNTPFSIIKSADKKRLQDIEFFPEQELNNQDKGIHLPDSGAVLKPLNVVVIMVESLSKEYVSCLNGKSKTPFLDSLFSKGLLFANGFANAKESIQGIPAILASIPSLQNDPFIFSPYSGNKITSIANLLKPYGYQSAFFHGGKKGTMGFDAFAALAGFDQYVGMEQFPDQTQFDGHWGIWDEPFLQFTATSLDQMQQPFVGAVFTLNTHHPFKMPEQYSSRFNMKGHPILGCVRYADYALEQFFRTAEKMPWYANTLFVITADHIGPKIGRSNYIQNYSIPICFFLPDGSLKARNASLASQIDILPSVMHLLNYPEPFFAMGNNLFSKDNYPFTITYNAGVYTCMDSAYCYQFNGMSGKGLYRWQTDPGLSINYAGRGLSAQKNHDMKIKKFIQLFNGSMIHNRMHISQPSIK
ncbi:MAG: sulfatase-like hydrolase/transferase [Saprospiraceae bacterium]|nr:sulfatase-like hydrolase/transferase [Saprospiraceae bacterium]